MRTQQLQTQQRQSGLVSIMVTMVFMIVLSLIVLGFAQVSRRNQRQSLDRQLSASAFYAAETAVNDVRNLIKTAGDPPPKTSCSNGGLGGYYHSLDTLSSLNTNAKLSYTCVLVNPAPKSLPYTIANTGTVIPIKSAGNPLGSITITWNKSGDSTTSLAGCDGSLRQVDNWNCSYAALRFDLVRTDGVMTMSSLQSGTMGSVFVPVSSGGTTNNITFAGNGGSNRVDVACTNTDCHATIDHGLGGSQYYMRISSLYYNSTNIQITAADTSNNPVGLYGALVIIDATGKAQDVLRRVQVRAPVRDSSENAASDYALESSDSICKRFKVMTGYFASDAATQVPTMDDGGNILCKDASGPSGAAGNSAFSSCTSGCTPSGGGHGSTGLSWTRYFVNKTTSNPLPIKGCTWTWGDGTTDTGSLPGNDKGCLYNEAWHHDYHSVNPKLDPASCHYFNVSLTVTLTDNSVWPSLSQSTYVPHGTGAPTC